MRLNLGSGNVLKEGFQNLDAIFGHRLPDHLRTLQTASVDLVFSEHFIEHLEWGDAVALMRECRRILRPEGVLRFSCPDVRVLIDRYLKGEIREYGGAWLPDTPCAMLNEGQRLWGHLYMYDRDEILRLAQMGGFTRAAAVAQHAECDRYNFGDLYLEAKP
jgi:predicted SAM-dependent methyltransferase